MKEKLYTIPLNDAVNAHDECPFCVIERNIEHDWLDYVLGSAASYMETDTRDITDKEGFCRAHFQKMFDYGNTLGNAWILKTHYMRTIEQMKQQFKGFTPGKTSFKDRLRKTVDSENAIGVWVRERGESCYICNRYQNIYERYMDTFFYLYKQDPEFRQKIKDSKGFCLPHFADLCQAADKKFSDKEKEAFYQMVFPLMEENMQRIADDIAWMIEKFDYRNKDADWKNSRDAIQRGMQKLKGGYPADPDYKMNK